MKQRTDIPTPQEMADARAALDESRRAMLEQQADRRVVMILRLASRLARRIRNALDRNNPWNVG